jgi:hypothetical protein
MNNSYDRCQALYRAARTYEGSSQADRHAVRMALAAAVTASVPAAAAAASATSVAASGTYSAAPGASAAGAKGILHVLLGGKLLSGVMVGTVLGTALSTTVFVGIPAMQSRVAVSSQSRPSSAAAERTLNSGRSSETPGQQQIEQAPAAIPQPPNEMTRMVVVADVGLPRSHGATGDRLAVVNSTVSRVPPQDRLQEETQALAKVQDALSLKNPNLAWTLLQEQDRQFQSGQLGEERAAAKVMALCAAGRNLEAERARAAFASSYPNSPLTKRVNKDCDH